MELANDVEMSVAETMEKLRARAKDLDNRASELDIKHEDVVVMQRYDNLKTLTFLALDDNNSGHRMRTSWYGRIIKISEVECGDEIREKKKLNLKKDDVIIFNPDAAYSLNVAGFEEIWIIHIDSILAVDTGYDYMKAMETNARRAAEIHQERHVSMIRQFEAKGKLEAIQAKARQDGIKK